MEQKFKYKTERLPKSEVGLEVEIEASELARAKSKILRKWQEGLEVDGFRKGQAPENIVVQKVGEGRILEDAAEMLINEYFPKITEAEKLGVLGHPHISIKKLALDNPLEFRATFAVLPEVELPDYKKIAGEIVAKPASTEVTAGEEEVNEVLLQIRKNKAHYDKEEVLPPLDDELAKASGNFKNLDELKEKIKENIIEDKKYRNLEKTRAKIMEELIKQTDFEIPEILVASEVEKSLAQVKDDVERMKGKWEDYLVHIKKTEEEFKKDLREPAEKRAKIQLIFNKIAEVEKLEPDKTILESEVKKLMGMYPEAREESARIYVATQLLNVEVLKLLERQ